MEHHWMEFRIIVGVCAIQLNHFLTDNDSSCIIAVRLLVGVHYLERLLMEVRLYSQ